MPAPHWKVFPSPKDVRARINTFITELQKANFSVAFSICPAITRSGKKPTFLDTTKAAAVSKFVGHALFQAIEGQEAIEVLVEPVIEASPVTWCGLLTPPSKVKYKDLNLSMPEGERGEVLANLHLTREVTDVTGRYELLSVEGGWLLAFSNFGVM